MDVSSVANWIVFFTTTLAPLIYAKLHLIQIIHVREHLWTVNEYHAQLLCARQHHRDSVATRVRATGAQSTFWSRARLYTLAMRLIAVNYKF